MATPADQRLLELLDKWRDSLELHAEYSKLDDDAYWKVQPWVEHQRPTRWIIDLARQKTAALRAAVEQRIAAQDTGFSDALELMIFLANLVGAEHIERFIPVATAQDRSAAGALEGTPERAGHGTAETREMPRPAPVGGTDTDGAAATREMPKMPPPRRASPAPGVSVARTERGSARPVMPAKPARPSRAAAQGAAPEGAPPPGAAPRAGMAQGPREAGSGGNALGAGGPVAGEQVVADAVRLLRWGRRWFELAELIARMADRPPLTEVRRILKDNRAAIEARIAEA